MAGEVYYRLKATFLDSGGGNRLNCINLVEYKIYPDMFEESTTGAVLSNFSTATIQDNVDCTIRTSGSGTGTQFFVTPDTNNNTFSFKLVVNGYVPSFTIDGFALDSTKKPISIGLIKSTLSETVRDIHALNNSPNINPFSPIKPIGTLPDSFDEWVGYCHNALGGFNIYNASGGDIPRGSTYEIVGSITRNTEILGNCMLAITGQTSITKDLSGDVSPFIEFKSGLLTNNNYFKTTTTIRVEGFSWNGSQFVSRGHEDVTLILRGLPVSAQNLYVHIGSNNTHLDTSFKLFNDQGFTDSISIRIRNVTKSSAWVICANAQNMLADTNTTVTQTNNMGVVNEAGDEFECQIQSYVAQTWTYDIDASSGTIPFNGGA